MMCYQMSIGRFRITNGSRCLIRPNCRLERDNQHQTRYTEKGHTFNSRNITLPWSISDVSLTLVKYQIMRSLAVLAQSV